MFTASLYILFLITIYYFTVVCHCEPKAKQSFASSQRQVRAITLYIITLFFPKPKKNPFLKKEFGIFFNSSCVEG